MISSFENLKKSQSVLIRKRQWRSFVTEGLGMITIFFMAPLLVIGSSLEPFDVPLFIAGIISTIVYAIVIVKAYQYRKKPPLKNHQLIFISFFDACKDLHELALCYRAKQSELYKKNKDSAISAIRSLLIKIKLWIPTSAPSGLVKIQTDIKDIFEKDIIQTIKNDDEEKFGNFADYFLQTCDALHKRDFTYDEWVVFKEKISEYGTKPKDESKPKDDLKRTQVELGPLVQSYGRSKEIIGAIVWVGVSISFYIGGHDLLLSFAYAAPIAGAAAYIFSKQTIKFDKNKKSDSV